MALVLLFLLSPAATPADDKKTAAKEELQKFTKPEEGVQNRRKKRITMVGNCCQEGK